ncbi:ion transporter [Roseovarius sp. EL26]|uniref:ion transporter n=1 Tax=Roseovarius sp. EL26 TaxID=2126672 RepID=UPI000EA139BE|nr:ion transporter [Roseovarius sp. EL26]
MYVILCRMAALFMFPFLLILRFLLRPFQIFLAYAKKRDAEIARETPPRARDWHWFLVKFYPRSRRKIAPADKCIAPVVVIAIIFAIWELLVLAAPVFEYFEFPPLKDKPNLFGWVTVSFFIIFCLEFCIRFFLKGWQYMRPWGLIDLLVILIDGVSSAFFLGLFGTSHGTGAGGVLRALRLFRLIRIAKIFRYLAEWRHIRRFIRSARPYATALLSCALFAVLIVIVILFCAFLIAGSDPWLKFAELIAQVIDALKPNSAASGTTTIASIFVLAAIANMIAIIFMPIMGKISEQQKQLAATELVEAHIIFCLNDIEGYEGTLEEFVHVFHKNAQRDIFILVDEETDGVEQLDLDFGQSVQVVSGDLTEPKIWRQAIASRASAIFMLGSKDDLSASDIVLLSHDSQSQRPGPLTIFELHNDSTKSYQRKQYEFSEDIDIVGLSFQTLRDRIETYAWNRRSLQYAYLQSLADDYEEEIEFPELAYVEGNTQSAQALAKVFSDDPSLKVEIRTHNLLIQSTEHSLETSDDPIDELRMLEKVRRTLASHPEEASGTCVFVYVETLELVEWNSRFSAMGNANVSVIAVEITSAFALLHEMEYPGILTGWFCELDDTNGVAQPRVNFENRYKVHSPEVRRNTTPSRLGSLIGLEGEWVVLGQQGSTPTPKVASKPSDRIEVDDTGTILIGRKH